MNDFQDLLGSPIGMLPSQFKQRFGDAGVGFIGEVMWLSRQVLKSAWPVIGIAFHPLIPCLAGDIVAIAEFSKRKPLLGKISDETNFFVHR